MSHEASGLKDDKKKVLKGAFLMAAGTLTSRILGLFRDVAMAALFDRAITDAWTAAFRLPNLFRRLLGEGSLSVSFIPIYLEARQEDPSGVRAQNLVNILYSFFLIFMGGFTVLGIIYMEPLLRLMLSDEYLQNSAKMLLTVRMAKIMFGFVYFVSTYAYFAGVLNALGSFGMPAVAPALLNISMLVFTFLPRNWFTMGGDGLAWGVLLGGLLQSFFLWLVLRSRGYWPRLSLSFKFSEDIKNVLRNMLPALFGLGLLQISTLVNLHFSSALGEGAISYIYWADRLLELPLSLVSVSLGTALLPSLTEMVLNGQSQKFKKTVEEHFILALFLAIPAALGLFTLAVPIVEILFKRGQFSALDVSGTATVLKVYAMNLLFVSSVRVLSPAFFAMKNTWLPATTALVALIVHILWAPWWIKLLGLKGLVVSSLLASAFQFLLMVTGLRIFIMEMKWPSLGRQFSKIFISGSILGLAVQVYSPLLELFNSFSEAQHSLFKMLALFISIILGGALYLSSASIMGLEPARAMVNFIKGYLTSAKEL